MKQLVVLLTILLVACSKPMITTETKTLYYKIQEVDKDGKTYDSIIQYVKVDSTLVIRDGDGDGDEDDDDDDHHHCDTTLPIKIGTFTVTKMNNNNLRVSWEAENEENVDHYLVLRSTDSKNWVARLKHIPDLSGRYTIIDKY